MAAETITIKGIREGLIVSLPTTYGAWRGALEQLETRLDASPAFFKGARVGLIIGAWELGEDDIREARDLLLRHDVILWALISDNLKTQEAAARLGLDTKLPQREVRPQPAPLPAEPAPASDVTSQTATDVSETAMVVHRTLRSGVSLRHPGSLIIIGDVHSGAEVIAGGDVVVWGKLHGTVHAGAFGDNEAVVCALDLTPTQLRIGHIITRSPDDHRRKIQPEMARVMRGRIEAVAWNPKASDR